MSLDTQTAPVTAADTGPLTIDQAVERQIARHKKPVEIADDPDRTERVDALVEEVDELIPDSEADTQTADDGDGAPETDTSDAEQVTEPEPAKQTLEPPSRWEAEDKAMFATLPVKAQETILRREKQQQAEVTKAQQKSADTAKQFETRIQHLGTLAATIGEHYVDPGLARMREWDAWFASDDADALAQQNPAEYLQQQNRFRREKRELDDHIAKKSAAEAEAFSAYVQEQARLMPEMIPEFADEAEGPKRKTELATYLREKGFEPDRIKGISAQEAQLAWKAKQFDGLPKDLSEKLRKADLYDKSMALANKAPSPKPKDKAGPSAPAAGQGQTPSSSEAQLKALLAKPNWSADDHVRHAMLKQKIGKQ